MNVELLIVTFHRDVGYLSICLASISKYASGFSGVTCVYPEQDKELITPLCAYYDVNAVTFHEDRRCGHLHHMVQKCRADQHCPTADLIVHIDADCMFFKPVTPTEYLVDSLPLLLIQKYESLKGAVPWKPIVDSTMKMNAIYETMRWHPAIHWRGIYADLRAHVERVNNKTFDKFLCALKNDFPPGFSEFNALGQIVLSTQWKEKYAIHDLDKKPFPKSKLIQFWSHSPPDKPQGIWHEGVFINVVPSDMASRYL